MLEKGWVAGGKRYHVTQSLVSFLFFYLREAVVFFLSPPPCVCVCGGHRTTRETGPGFLVYGTSVL